MTTFVDSNLTVCQIRGTYLNDNFTPMAGSVSFTPSPTVVLNADMNHVYISHGFTISLDVTGSFIINLIATDNAVLNPNNFTYTVNEQLSDPDKIGVEYNNTYSITALTADSPINIADVTPVNDYTGTPIVRGRPGSGGTGGGGTSVTEIGYDTDGVPYLLDTSGLTGIREIGFDTDGVPYLL